MLRAIFLSLLTGAVLSTFGYDGYGQKAVNKFPRAIERSGDAARIISLLSNAESGLPKELIDQAKAIGVFPKVTKETSMFTQVTQGFGVISARLETGWTVPAFYAFGGGGYGKPFARTEMSSTDFAIHDQRRGGRIRRRPSSAERRKERSCRCSGNHNGRTKERVGRRASCSLLILQQQVERNCFSEKFLEKFRTQSR